MHAIAKTNLFLRVKGELPGGYHELENLFVPLNNLYDELELKPNTTGGIHLQVNGLELSAGKDNLCLKAAQLFCEKTGLAPDVDIVLTKHIPIAAGLGGGSSDAAAVLKLLNEYCHFPLSKKELLELAAALGADVPYFLNPVVALGRGRGDLLETVPWKMSLGLLLVTPSFPLPVKWAFSHLKAASPSSPDLSDFLSAVEKNDRKKLIACCRNDLEEAIFEKFPLLEMMRRTLLDLGACCVHVSGSGPSLYAIVEQEQLMEIARKFAQEYPDFPEPITDMLFPCVENRSGKVIRLAEPLGFCGGVQRALDIFENVAAQASETNEPIYVLHELVHNATVTERMKARGAHFVDSLDEIPDGALTLFGAHGIGNAIEAKAMRKKLRYTNAVCPKVSHLQEAVSKEPADVPLILFGDKEHPEVKSIWECSSANQRFLLDSLTDIETLPPLQKAILVSQTTRNAEKVREVTEALKTRIPQLHCCANVCDAVSRRQQAVVQLSRQCDLFIVVGSPHSSNGRRLLAIAQENCPAIMVEEADQLPLELIHKAQWIGLATATSTPEDAINGIVTVLSSAQ